MLKVWNNVKFWIMFAMFLAVVWNANRTIDGLNECTANLRKFTADVGQAAVERESSWHPNWGPGKWVVMDGGSVNGNLQFIPEYPDAK